MEKMENNYRGQNYTRRDFLKNLGNTVLGVGAAGLVGGCAMSPLSTERGITQQQFEKDRIKHSVENYGAIDDYVKAAFENNDPAMLVQGIVLYPTDFALDAARGAKALVYDIPIEAWRRATNTEPKNYDNGIVKVLFAPIDAAFGAANLAAQYGIVAVEGTIKHIAKKPLEGIAHILTGAAIAHNNCKGGGGKGGAGESPAPGTPGKWE